MKNHVTPEDVFANLTPKELIKFTQRILNPIMKNWNDLQKKNKTEEVRTELMTYAKNLKRVFGEKEAIRVLASLKSGMKKEYPTLDVVCDALVNSKATFSFAAIRYGNHPVFIALVFTGLVVLTTAGLYLTKKNTVT